MSFKIQSLRIAFDHVADYIPVVSTVNNLVDLFQKAAYSGKQENKADDLSYRRYVTSKSSLECFLLLIPIIGNAYVWLGYESSVSHNIRDEVKREKSFLTDKQWAPLKDLSLKSQEAVRHWYVFGNVANFDDLQEEGAKELIFKEVPYLLAQVKIGSVRYSKMFNTPENQDLSYVKDDGLFLGIITKNPFFLLNEVNRKRFFSSETTNDSLNKRRGDPVYLFKHVIEPLAEAKQDYRLVSDEMHAQFDKLGDGKRLHWMTTALRYGHTAWKEKLDSLNQKEQNDVNKYVNHITSQKIISSEKTGLTYFYDLPKDKRTEYATEELKNGHFECFLKLSSEEKSDIAAEQLKKGDSSCFSKLEPEEQSVCFSKLNREEQSKIAVAELKEGRKECFLKLEPKEQSKIIEENKTLIKFIKPSDINSENLGIKDSFWLKIFMEMEEGQQADILRAEKFDISDLKFDDQCKILAGSAFQISLSAPKKCEILEKNPMLITSIEPKKWSEFFQFETVANSSWEDFFLKIPVEEKKKILLNSESNFYKLERLQQKQVFLSDQLGLSREEKFDMITTQPRLIHFLTPQHWNEIPPNKKSSASWVDLFLKSPTQEQAAFLQEGLKVFSELSLDEQGRVLEDKNSGFWLLPAENKFKIISNEPRLLKFISPSDCDEICRQADNKKSWIGIFLERSFETMVVILQSDNFSKLPDEQQMLMFKDKNSRFWKLLPIQQFRIIELRPELIKFITPTACKTICERAEQKDSSWATFFAKLDHEKQKELLKDPNSFFFKLDLDEQGKILQAQDSPFWALSAAEQFKIIEKYPNLIRFIDPKKCDQICNEAKQSKASWATYFLRIDPQVQGEMLSDQESGFYKLGMKEQIEIFNNQQAGFYKLSPEERYKIVKENPILITFMTPAQLNQINMRAQQEPLSWIDGFFKLPDINQLYLLNDPKSAFFTLDLSDQGKVMENKNSAFWKLRPDVQYEIIERNPAWIKFLTPQQFNGICSDAKKNNSWETIFLKSSAEHQLALINDKDSGFWKLSVSQQNSIFNDPQIFWKVKTRDLSIQGIDNEENRLSVMFDLEISEQGKIFENREAGFWKLTSQQQFNMIERQPALIKFITPQDFDQIFGATQQTKSWSSFFLELAPQQQDKLLEEPGLGFWKLPIEEQNKVLADTKFFFYKLEPINQMVFVTEKKSAFWKFTSGQQRSFIERQPGLIQWCTPELCKEMKSAIYFGDNWFSSFTKLEPQKQVDILEYRKQQGLPPWPIGDNPKQDLIMQLTAIRLNARLLPLFSPDEYLNIRRAEDIKWDYKDFENDCKNLKLDPTLLKQVIDKHPAWILRSSYVKDRFFEEYLKVLPEEKEKEMQNNMNYIFNHVMGYFVENKIDTKEFAKTLSEKFNKLTKGQKILWVVAAEKAGDHTWFLKLGTLDQLLVKQKLSN